MKNGNNKLANSDLSSHLDLNIIKQYVSENAYIKEAKTFIIDGCVIVFSILYSLSYVCS